MRFRNTLTTKSFRSLAVLGLAFVLAFGLHFLFKAKSGVSKLLGVNQANADVPSPPK